MLKRARSFLGCVLLAAVGCGGDAPSETRSTLAFELWATRGALPPEGQIEFLPLFLATETPGFVDTGDVVTHAGKTHKALQYTRDKELTATIPINKYLVGPIGDEWPAGSVNPFDELHAARLEAVDIDGVRVKVTPSDILDLSSAEGSFALYTILPRFTTTGQHTLVYSWRQVRNFYFTYPYAAVGMTDPDPVHEGRRVFVAGESAGTDLDGLMTVRYTLNVVR